MARAHRVALEVGRRTPVVLDSSDLCLTLGHISYMQASVGAILYPHNGQVEWSCSQLTKQTKSNVTWLQGTVTALSVTEDRHITQVSSDSSLVEPVVLPMRRCWWTEKLCLGCGHGPEVRRRTSPHRPCNFVVPTSLKSHSSARHSLFARGHCRWTRRQIATVCLQSTSR